MKRLGTLKGGRARGPYTHTHTPEHGARGRSEEVRRKRCDLVNEARGHELQHMRDGLLRVEVTRGSE